MDSGADARSPQVVEVMIKRILKALHPYPRLLELKDEMLACMKAGNEQGAQDALDESRRVMEALPVSIVTMHAALMALESMHMAWQRDKQRESTNEALRRVMDRMNADGRTVTLYIGERPTVSQDGKPK